MTVHGHNWSGGAAAFARAVLLPAAWGLLVPVAAPAQQVKAPSKAAPHGSQESMQKIERRFAATPNVSVRLMGSVGTIRVTGWDKDSVVVLGTIPSDARFEAAIGGDGRSPSPGAKMFVESPNDQSVASGVIELRLPAKGRAWVKSGTANIDVSDVVGGVDLNTVGGSVHLAGSPREVQIEAMDAAVAIDGSPPWLRVKTASGDITWRGSSNDVVLSSVSGVIRAEGGSIERARLETVTGGIVFSSDIAAAGDVALESHSGTVEVRLPSKGEFEVSATTVTGSIDNRFDYRAPIAGREGRGQELTVGRGWERARATVRTFKGTIVISRR